MFLLAKVRERLGPQSVRLGHELRGLEVGGPRPCAQLHDRESNSDLTITPDLLLGADGIHSQVRRAFYPDEGSPLWNGITLWRSTAPIDAPMGGRAMIWAGTAAQKFVAYPIGPDPVTGAPRLNWICDLKVADIDSPPPRDWNKLGDTADFLPRFADWRWNGVDVPAIVAAAGPIYEFPMIDRDPLPQWTFGHATLLGDAAHPMYPIGSNGATQGIIDARVLAWHLANASSIPAALAAYESDRREATARIVLMNRQKGPDQVLDLAAERLKAGGALASVLPHAERLEIADRYKKIAGFDPATLNARSSYSVGPE
jgi:2-polyprenyl-6-methoxyphenol hydroxylase-like FAD-dependent oxidoreductase